MVSGREQLRRRYLALLTGFHFRKAGKVGVTKGEGWVTVDKGWLVKAGCRQRKRARSWGYCMEVLGDRGPGEMTGDGKFKVVNEGVKDFGGLGLVDNSVVPFLGEADQRFWGYVVKGDQSFVSLGVLGGVVIKERPEIFDPGEHTGRVIRAIAGVNSGGCGGRGKYTVDRGSEDGEGHGEHGVWGAGGCLGIKGDEDGVWV